MEMPNLKRPQISNFESWQQGPGREDKYSRVEEYPYPAPYDLPRVAQMSILMHANYCIFGGATLP